MGSLIHLVLVLLTPPLLLGVINKTKAWFAGRRGPPLSQAYWDIWRLLNKGGVDKIAGTGIGLAIVAKAVERMKGAYGVESKTGEGSRFWIELNAAP